MAKEKKEKGKPLRDTIKEIKEKFGEDAIMTMDEKPNVDVGVISTGSLGIDMATGIGGFPRGRIVEIYGPESSGKTTVALHVVAEAQKAGGVCAFIDAEHAMDPQYAKKLGVNVEQLYIAQPSSGEEGLQIVDSLVQGGRVDVIVVDSVAALPPLSEIEGQIGEVKVGAQARLMSQGLRVLTGSIAKSNTLVIFINQVRVNIGGFTGFGAPPETTAGGKALKFYASIRMDVRKIATIKDGEQNIGSRVKAKIVKNKVARPFEVAEFDIIYNHGISREGEALDLGEKLGVIEKKGNTLWFREQQLGRGHESARQFLYENRDALDVLIMAIRDQLQGKKES